MSVLVTGGAGFIGSHLVDALLARGSDVIVFDSLDPQVHPGGQVPPWLAPRARFVRGDVRDRDALEAVIDDSVEVIYHLAAAVGVGQSQYEIKHYVDVNVGGTANLLDVLAKRRDQLKVRKLIVAASMSSYGEGLYHSSTGEPFRPGLRAAEDVDGGKWEPLGPDGQPLTAVPTPESCALNVSSVYALTKRDQEDLVLNYGRTYGLPVVALRYFNVYGARQSLNNPYTGVAAIFLSRLKNDRAPLIYEDGQQTRDFVSVSDIVAANLLAMDRDGADGYAVNVGTGSPLTVEQVASALGKALGKDIAPEVTGQFRKGDIRHCFPDITRARQMLGYEPQVTFEAGVEQLLAWAREQEAIDRSEQANAELRRHGLV